jgi:membrane protease YdiL (CAAX protease family)
MSSAHAIGTHRETPAPRWPIGSRGAIFLTLGLVIGHFLLAFGVGGLLARALHLNGRTIYQASPASFVMLVSVAALEVGVLFGLLMRGVGRLGFREVGWRSLTGRDISLGVMGFAVCGCAVVLMLAGLFGSAGAAWNYLVRSVSAFSAQQRVFFVLMGAFAAFAEETIFRGILQPTLQRKLGRWPGLVVTAVIFAVYHLKFKPAALLGKLAIGLVLGGLRERTGTLWAPAIAHALIWVVLGST